MHLQEIHQINIKRIIIHKQVERKSFNHISVQVLQLEFSHQLLRIFLNLAASKPIVKVFILLPKVLPLKLIYLAR